MILLSELFKEISGKLFPLGKFEQGQTLIEYILIITVIALAVTAAMLLLQGNINAFYIRAGNSMGM